MRKWIVYQKTNNWANYSETIEDDTEEGMLSKLDVAVSSVMAENDVQVDAVEVAELINPKKVGYRLK